METIMYNLKLTKEMHKRFKILAAEREITLLEVIIEALEKYLSELK